MAPAGRTRALQSSLSHIAISPKRLNLVKWEGISNIQENLDREAFDGGRAVSCE